MAMDVPGISRPVLVVLIVAAVLLFAFGATKAVGLLTERTDTQTRTLAAAPTIVVHTGTGDVRIIAADRTDVRLTTKEKRSIWGGGHVRVSGDAADLRLKDHCDGSWLVDDDAAWTRSSRCRGRPACGWSPARAICGPRTCRATPSCGRAPATCAPSGSAGRCGSARRPATCTSRGRRPTSSRARARATSTSQTSRPGSVDAQADTGDIHISVPDLTYAVDAHTGTGDENVDVRRDDASPRKLRAHTDTGDVHLEPDG